MSVPRVLLAPTHRTGLADAIAAAVSEILAAQGREVRYHHLGPLAPMSSWDRAEGSVFIDPGLTGEDTALGLYEVAVRNAEISLLSSTSGLLDRAEGVNWVPADLVGLLDCPVVVVMDCRGWATGIKLLSTGIKSHLRSADLVGAILTGVSDQDHCELLKDVLAEDGIRVVGCVYSGQVLDWDIRAPGPWGLPLSPELVESVAKQVDVGALGALASQRGFLATRKRLSDHSGQGPVVMVASGRGFTQWSRDSVEVLRSAGAQVRRLDLLQDTALPPDVAGLVIAGTLWPDNIQDISMNTSLLGDIADKVKAGLPTLALGGGMLVMLSRVQDTLGRSSEFAGVIPAQGEILWDLDEPVYVEVEALGDNLLFARGERVTGWVQSEVDLVGSGQAWDPPLLLRGAGAAGERRATFGGGSLLCSPALVHLAAVQGAAARFVKQCEAYSGARQNATAGDMAWEQ